MEAAGGAVKNWLNNRSTANTAQTTNGQQQAEGVMPTQPGPSMQPNNNGAYQMPASLSQFDQGNLSNPNDLYGQLNNPLKKLMQQQSLMGQNVLGGRKR